MTGERMRGIVQERNVKAGRVALACARAATLGGCGTLGPDYQRPDIALPQAWRSD